MEAIGRFAGGIVHDIKNILTVLLLNTDLLEDDYNVEHHMDELSGIRESIEEIKKMSELLINFSHTRDQKFGVFAPVGEIQSLQRWIRNILGRYNILEITSSIDSLRIRGDIDKFRQAIINLVMNAKDAMDSVKGKKELAIGTGLSEADGFPAVVVSLKDTGVGISREHLDKVLEPFFTTKPVGQGTGLGLSLCFGIVENHGGRLEIESTPDEGTEVKVILPVKDSGKE